MNDIAAMDEFTAFSRALGRDRELVQGAGGNSSIKFGDRMRIKASGAWLADAGDKEIFIDIALAPLRSALADDFDDASLKAALETGGKLRPSIETPLHALSPFQVTAHVHSANAIAWSVMADRRNSLAERLNGLDWAFIEYVRPGAPLAMAVRDVYANGRPSVLILGGHGLVIAADTVGAARALLSDVETRLRIEPQSAQPPKPAHEAPDPPAHYRWALDSAAAFLAHDEARARLVAAGSLYPDHVVFLGPGMLRTKKRSAIGAIEPAPKAAIIDGVGMLVRDDLTVGALAMLECLGLVAARLDPDASINYLSKDDERALLGWDAETYRQALDRRVSAATL